MKKSFLRAFTFSCVLLLMCACSTSTRSPRNLNQDYAPSRDVDVSKLCDAIPKAEPRSKYGNPRTYRVLGRTYSVMSNSRGFHQRGIASWYGMKFNKHRTSSGEPYNLYAMTAAHKTLPLPTYVRVTNLQNHRSCVVKVNDRGPFKHDRIIDLSYAAARKLGVFGRGTALVEIVALEPGHPMGHIQAPLPFHRGPKIYLQLGAFSQAGNANSLQYKLQSWTSRIPIRVQASPIHGKNIYRVHIGPFSDIAQSDAMAKKLRAKGYTSVTVRVQ